MTTRRMLALAVVTGTAAALLGVGTWWVVSGDEPSPEDAVEAFFEARQRGDCAGLLAVVSAASWSENGRLDREEFREFCADIVGEFQPRLHEVEVRTIDGDHATVRMEVLVDEDLKDDPRLEDAEVREGLRLARADGSLVREDEEWKVKLDQHVLALGRSPEQTVQGFLAAYQTGDCESLIGHLSERAWSRSGTVDRATFMADCLAEAEARWTPRREDSNYLSPKPLLAMPQHIEVSAEDGVTMAAIEVPWAFETRTETVRLVVEDLQWKVDTPTLEAFEYIELGSRLLGGPKRPRVSEIPDPVFPDEEADILDELSAADDAETRKKWGYRRGLATQIGVLWRAGQEILLYEFDDAGGAQAYAQRLFESATTPIAEYYGLSPVPVPGVPGGKAMAVECRGSGCQRANRAIAVGTRGRYLAAVDVTDYTGPDPTADQMAAQAIKVLRTQLDRLDVTAR